jgi:hypothetical protein
LIANSNSGSKPLVCNCTVTWEIAKTQLCVGRSLLADVTTAVDYGATKSPLLEIKVERLEFIHPGYCQAQVGFSQSTSTGRKK